MSEPQSSLARIQAPNPMDEEELDKLYREAWHEHSIAILKPEDMPRSDDKQAIIRAANRAYGERQNG